MHVFHLRYVAATAILLTSAATMNRAQKAELHSQWQVLTPVQLPPPEATYNPMTGQWAVTNELFNPTSGFYAELSQQPKRFSSRANQAPLPGSPVDVYGRFSWHSLERSEGDFDFAAIDNVLRPSSAQSDITAGLPPGGRFSFSIMAFTPQYWSSTNVTTGTDGYPVYSDVPSYMMKDSAGKTHGWLLPVEPSKPALGNYFIPDWNDPYFLNRIDSLMKALGKRYNNDPRIGFIDIGFYGSWGEWHTSGLPDTTDYTRGHIPYSPNDALYSANTAAYQANKGVQGAYQVGSEDSKNAIIWAHVKAFPNKQLLMLTDDVPALSTAMHIDEGTYPIGLRRNSWGSYTGWYAAGFPSKTLLGSNTYDLVINRWKTAPFVVEPFGTGSARNSPCQTLETDPNTGEFEVLKQTYDFHIAAIKNAYFCSGSWANLTKDQQQSILVAGLRSGNRISLRKMSLLPFDEGSRPRITLHSEWINSGLTPTYDRWNVEFSLWTSNSSTSQKVATFISRMDLRKVIPPADNSLSYDGTFSLPPSVAVGTYELRVRVIDPNGYLRPFQLALQGHDSDWYYPLGSVVIPRLINPVR